MAATRHDYQRSPISSIRLNPLDGQLVSATLGYEPFIIFSYVQRSPFPLRVLLKLFCLIKSRNEAILNLYRKSRWPKQRTFDFSNWMTRGIILCGKSVSVPLSEQKGWKLCLRIEIKMNSHQARSLPLMILKRNWNT